MKYENLQRYTPAVYPGEKSRGLILKLEPSEDGEAVLLKDLPQKISPSEELPKRGSGETVILYFKDGTHTFGTWMGSYWNVMCFGPVEEEVVAWRRILT